MWKLKKNADGTIAVDANGNPIYVNDSGAENAYDVNKLVAKIGELNSEAKNHRLEKEKAEEKLKAFEGINPEDAKNASDILTKYREKKLYESGDVEKLKSEMNSTWQSKLDAATKQRDELQNRINTSTLKAAFAGSPFLSSRLMMPVDFAQAAFQSRFKVTNEGQVVALDANGGDLMSRKNPGDRASFDEAMEMFIEAHPQKDQILKAPNKSGSGSPNNGGSGSGGNGQTISRAGFEALSAVSRADFISKGGKVTE